MHQHKTRPDYLVATQEEPQDPCHNWKGTPSFAPQLEMRPYSPAATQEESQGSPHNSKGGLTPLRQP